MIYVVIAIGQMPGQFIADRELRFTTERDALEPLIRTLLANGYSISVKAGRRE